MSTKQACSEGLLDGKLLANGKDEPHQAEKYLPKNVKQGLILFHIKDASFSLDADHTNLPFLSDVLSDYSLHFFSIYKVLTLLHPTLSQEVNLL